MLIIYMSLSLLNLTDCIQLAVGSMTLSYVRDNDACVPKQSRVLPTYHWQDMQLCQHSKERTPNLNEHGVTMNK